MRKQNKIGILCGLLLIFSLITGSVSTLPTQAVGTCPIPSPNPLADSGQRVSALSELNAIRSSVFIANTVNPVTLPNVTDDTGGSGQGAQNHATYLANNPGDFNLAFEKTNATVNCFTTSGSNAARFAERFANPAVNSNTPSLKDAVDLAANSVYLRLPLLDPRLQRVGLGFDTNYAVIDTSNVNAQNFTSNLPSSNFNGYVIGYPGPNAIGVPTGSSTVLVQGEGILNSTTGLRSRVVGGVDNANNSFGLVVDPITGNSTPSSVGYPISLVFDRATYNNLSIDVANSTLTDSATNSTVPVFIKNPTDVNNIYNYGDVNFPGISAAIMIPATTLRFSAQYQVKFTFTASNSVNSQTVSWTFTTGSGSSSPTPTPTSTGTITPTSTGSITATTVSGTPTPTIPANGTPTPTFIIVPTSAAGTPTPTPGLPGVPGVPPTVGPTSFYQPTPANGQNPPAFFQVWRRVDDPVKNGLANRSWMYGPLPYGFQILYENYEGGRRIVAYHDKARMELNDGGYVSNGLLVREMISGALQLGDTKFDFRTPALQTVAGDPFELNPTAPTYYAFQKVASLNNDNRAPNLTGQQVVATMGRDGTVGVNYGTATYGVTYAYYDPNLGHNIANRFWDFMNQSGLVLDGGSYFNARLIDWTSVMGLPLSDPYWIVAQVNGQTRDVLVQVFERRVLTYTPANSPAFQVEMGNVGRSYYKWRYGQ